MESSASKLTLPDQGYVHLGCQVMFWNLKVTVKWVSRLNSVQACITITKESRNQHGLFSVGPVGPVGLRRVSVQSLASGKVEVAGSHHFFTCLAPSGSVSAQNSHLCPKGAVTWLLSGFLLIAVTITMKF